MPPTHDHKKTLRAQKFQQIHRHQNKFQNSINFMSADSGSEHASIIWRDAVVE